MSRPTQNSEHTAATPTHRAYPVEVSEAEMARQLASAQALLESQRRQIQELNHRIANSLQLAADMLTFEHLRARDPIAQAALEASRARLVAVGQLHRYLYDHADRRSVHLRTFLVGLGQAMAATTGLQCSIEADAITVSGDTAQQLAIVINECAINAAKHAYDGRPGGRLDVVARREGADLVLTVTDEGKGLDHASTPEDVKGLGMSIIGAVVRDLRGTLTVRSDGGAAFTIRAPLPAAASRSFLSWAAD